MAEVIAGPPWEGRNWAINAGAGSIHDDETAENLGFRGGTVPGDVHMNQFVPVLLQVFGTRWFETGNLSLNFKNATVDGEVVQVFAEKPDSNTEQTRVWMEREDGMVICEGTAALSDHSRSLLRTKDLRPVDPSELRILAGVSEGMSLGDYEVTVSPDKQFSLFDQGLISDPIDFYRTGSLWGDVIACPSTIVQQLWGIPMAGLRPFVADSVGLFGAMEIGHVNGPMILDRNYTIRSQVVCVGMSPQTEYLWFDSRASNEAGEPVADLRMMLRFMKASSTAYQQ